MSTPRVSIIIPIYNAEACIKACVDSIIAQTVSDFELLLIDDGSKDSSGKICDEYAQKDDRIKVFHQPNGGVSTARNLCLDKAQGEWISFVDADDLLESHFLEALNNTLATHADWIHCPWKNVWDDGRNDELNDYENEELIEGWEGVRNYWSLSAARDVCRCPWTKLFRRSIIEQHHLRFDVSLHYAEDTLFNYNYLLKVRNILTIKREGARYIYHQFAGTATIKKFKHSPDSIVKARDCIFEIFFEQGMQNRAFEILFFFSFATIEYIYLGKPDDSIRRSFYDNPIQKKLEERCLPIISRQHQVMYKAFKHLPHALLYPIAKVYLNRR